MSVTEAERAVLRQVLTEEIGEDSADILMRSTLRQGSDQLATKDDINALGTRVDGEFAKVQGEFAAVQAKIDGGFEAVHAKIDGGFEAVHAKIDGGFAKVYGEFAKVYGAITELKGHTESVAAKHSREMLFAMAGFLVTIWVTLIVAFIVLDNRLAATAGPPPPVAAVESLPSQSPSP